MRLVDAEHKSEAAISRKIATIAATLAFATLPLSMAAAQDHEPIFIDVTNPAEIESAVAVLNFHLDQLSPEIAVSRCQILIGARAGTVETIYAGICQLKSGAQAMVCGDTAAGNFGLMPWRPPRHGNVDWVAQRTFLLRFTRANCSGG